MCYFSLILGNILINNETCITIRVCMLIAPESRVCMHNFPKHFPKLGNVCMYMSVCM